MSHGYYGDLISPFTLKIARKTLMSAPKRPLMEEQKREKERNIKEEGNSERIMGQ